MGAIFGIVGNALNENDKASFTYIKNKLATGKTTKFEFIHKNNFYLGAYHLQKEHSASSRISNSTKSIIWTDLKLFNREELYLKLNRKIIEDLSDADLALLAYEQWKDDLIRHLKGEYLIMIIEKGHLKIISDPLGMRSFNYTYQNGRLYFCSFLYGIISLPNLFYSPNHNFFHQLLCSSSQFNKRSTLYQELHRLPNRSILTIKQGLLKIVQYNYFNLSSSKIRFDTEDEYIEAFRIQLEKAVIRRIDTTASSIGFEFSGGFDSTGIIAIGSSFCRQYDLDRYAFAKVLPPKESRKTNVKLYDNLKIINTVAQTLEIKNLYHIGNQNTQILDSLDDLIEEFSWLQTISTFEGIKEVGTIMQAKDMKQLFSGFGGDQCVTNRNLKFTPKSDNQSKKVKRLNYIQLLTNNTFFYLAKKIYHYLKPTSIVHPLDFNPLLNHHNIIANALKNRKYYRTANSLNELMIKLLDKPAVAIRVEKERTMAYKQGFEMEYPYLDISLIEFVLASPNFIKRQQNDARFFYKKAIAKWIDCPLFFKHSKSDNIGGTSPGFTHKNLSQLALSKLQIQQYEQDELFSFIDFHECYQIFDNPTVYTSSYDRAKATFLAQRILGIVRLLSKIDKETKQTTVKPI